MSVVEDTLKIIFTVEGAKAISDLGAIKKEVTGLGTASSKSGTLLSNIGNVITTVGRVALTATVAAAGFALALGVSAVKAAAEAEAEMTRVDVLLKNVSESMKFNTVAVGGNAKALTAQSKAISTNITGLRLRLTELSLSDKAGTKEYTNIQKQIVGLQKQALALDKTAVVQSHFIKVVNENAASFDELQKVTAKVSSSLSKLGFDDEQAALSFAKFLSITKDVDVAQKASIATADFARATNMDYASATTQVGLALQGSGRMLKQWNIDIPEGTTQMEALNIIMKTFGGNAEVYSRTFPGIIDRLKEWRQNLLEAAGKNGMEALKGALDAFVTRLESIDLAAFTQKIAVAFEDIQKKIEDFQKPLIAVWDYLKNNIIPIFVELFERIIKPMVIPAIELTTKNFKELWKELNLNSEEIGVLAALAKSTAVVLTVILAVAIDAVFLAINILIGVIRVVTALFKDFVSQITKARDSLQSLINGVSDLISWMNKIPSKITTTISTVEKKISGKASGGYASGWTLVGEQGPELVNFPGGSRVYNNSDTKNMMGGATVNIYNPSVRNDNDIQSIIDQVKSALGRQTELVRMGAL